MEYLYVTRFYETIADEFNDTRYSVWNFVNEFMKDKETKYGLDIGCGNGKNMLYDNMVGIDNCYKLLEHALNSNKQVHKACCCDLPFMDDTFDYTLCVSVIHHLQDEKRRFKAIHEMLRVVKPGGTCIFSVWSLENQERRKFQAGENLVEWKCKNNNKTMYRFCYIYNYDMILTLIRTIKGVHFRLKNEKGNWVVTLIKNVE